MLRKFTLPIIIFIISIVLLGVGIYCKTNGSMHADSLLAGGLFVQSIAIAVAAFIYLGIIKKESNNTKL